MRVTITHLVEVPSTQKATALRDKCAALLEEDADTTVITSNGSTNARSYRVVGVDTTSKKPFGEVVEADDPEGAAAQVVDGSKDRVVAEVTPLNG